MSALYPNTLNFPSAAPSAHGGAVVPANADLPYLARMLWVGSGGDVAVRFDSGAEVTFRNVPSGGWLGPFFVDRVLPATTAADIVALY